MKIWLDDLRPAPKQYIWCKTAEEVIKYLGTKTNELHTLGFECMHFDHDLGYDNQKLANNSTGYDLARLFEENAFQGNKFVLPRTYSIHSDNPVGIRNIRMAMSQIRNRYPDMAEQVINRFITTNCNNCNKLVTFHVTTDLGSFDTFCIDCLEEINEDMIRMDTKDLFDSEHTLHPDQDLQWL